MLRALFPAVLAVALAGPAAARGPKVVRLKVGDPAPSFVLRDRQDGLHRLSDFAGPSKKKNAAHSPVLLEYFRSDCPPCVEALPELVEIHQRYAARGLKVVLVALYEQQDGKARLERFLAEHPMPMTVLVDGTETYAQQYLGQPAKLPGRFLIDGSGKLVKVAYGTEEDLSDFEPLIESLLPKPDH